MLFASRSARGTFPPGESVPPSSPAASGSPGCCERRCSALGAAIHKVCVWNTAWELGEGVLSRKLCVQLRGLISGRGWFTCPGEQLLPARRPGCALPAFGCRRCLSSTPCDFPGCCSVRSLPEPSQVCHPCGLVRKAGRLLLLLAARELEADSRPERGGTVLLALGQLRWPLCVLALSFPSAGLRFLSPDAVDRLAEDYYFF